MELISFRGSSGLPVVPPSSFLVRVRLPVPSRPSVRHCRLTFLDRFVWSSSPSKVNLGSIHWVGSGFRVATIRGRVVWVHGSCPVHSSQKLLYKTKLLRSWLGPRFSGSKLGRRWIFETLYLVHLRKSREWTFRDYYKRQKVSIIL